MNPNFIDGVCILLRNTTLQIYWQSDMHEQGDIESPDPSIYNGLWYSICKNISEEFSILQLDNALHSNVWLEEELFSWIRQCTEQQLLKSLEIYYRDVHQIMFDRIDKFGANLIDILQVFSSKLNNLFKKHDLLYVLHDGRIHKSNSDIMQENVIEQTISILSIAGFETPLQNFQKGIALLREGENRLALWCAARAFESTLKTLVEKLGYQIDPKTSTSKMIDLLLTDNFFEARLGYFSKSLNQSLLNGLGALANPERHGQVEDKPVPYAYAMLGLHLAGSFITFLITLYQEGQIQKD